MASLSSSDCAYGQTDGITCMCFVTDGVCSYVCVAACLALDCGLWAPRAPRREEEACPRGLPLV